MSRFRDLIAGVNWPSVPNSAALIAAVAGSRLRLWHPGEPFATRGHRVLIGVAPYSASDMQLLDALNDTLAANGQNVPAVDIFDVLVCKDQVDFELFVPGLGQVFQTPVVGLWHDGILIDKASGAAGRELLRRVTGVDVASARNASESTSG